MAEIVRTKNNDKSEWLYPRTLLNATSLVMPDDITISSTLMLNKEHGKRLSDFLEG